jgi:hypothetical protein
MQIRSDDGKRIIGDLTGKIYTKRVRGSKHQLRVPPAWGIDEGAVTQIARMGATSIQIHDTEKDIYYSCELATFQAHCLVMDRGFGRQLALPMKRWRVDKQPNIQHALL